MTHPHIRHLRTALENRQAYYQAMKAQAEQLERERLDDIQAAQEQRQRENGQRSPTEGG